MITRIITGVIGIALAAFIIQTGGGLYSAAVLLLMLGGWFEFCKAFAHKGDRLAFFSGVLIMLLFWGTSWLGNDGEIVAVTMLAVMLIMAVSVFRHGSFTAEQALISLGGVMYLGLGFSHMILVRFAGEPAVVSTSLGSMELGCAYLWTALIGTWASDTFAYFSGTLLGKHKLCPSISPNKSVEGFIGSLVGTTAAVAGLGVFFGFNVPMMAGLGFCIALLATLGDLVESVVKRATGIKDSGNIIPGHGGIWDRFDSALYTIPFVYYFVQVFPIAG